MPIYTLIAANQADLPIAKMCTTLGVSTSGYYDWFEREPSKRAVANDALNMGLAARKPKGGIQHSDQGSQYTSVAFGHRCKTMGVRPSMGTVGDAYDNAMAESFFASLECALIDRRSWKNKTEARLAVFTWIERWYNPVRRHSGIGYQSPINFEKELQNKQKKKRLCNLKYKTSPANWG